MIEEITKEESETLLKKYFFEEFGNSSIDSPFNKTVVYRLNEIMGFINYDLIYDRIEINYIYVIEQFRNKGIAGELVKYIDKNIKNITLEVKESNIQAINFYLKMGFKKVSLRENYYKNENGILMIKED